jgi:dTDP-4-dehydrorhamnose 3,5-epimerase
MFQLNSTLIPDCYEIQPHILDDNRGRFVKVFQSAAFTELCLETYFSEEYYSKSHKGVVRGMHFQTPPADHVKLVYCVHGDVFDVVLDLRIGSPSYGRTATFKLSAKQGNCIYIPRGMAHGFCATSESATLINKVSNVHSPEHDAGVLWNTIDFDCPLDSAVISKRDVGFQKLANFKSPFIFSATSSQ